MQERDWRPESLTAQGLGWVDASTQAINPPIHMSSTFLRTPDYGTERAYIRDQNPAFEQAEALLAKLEGGAAAALLASGMAAATSVFMALKPGDHVVAPQLMYWSLRNWLLTYATEWGIEVTLVDMRDLAALRQAMRPGKTQLVWIETPGNPLWSVTDIAAAARIAHAAGARLAVDSTVATPVFTQPLKLGADIVMHSATKYLNGHSDLCAGALVTKEKDAAWERIIQVRYQLGAIPGSVDAWLLLRGMRSLFPRVRQQAATALTLAQRLAQHPAISDVLYPGLPGFPGHEIAKAQMQGGFGGMLSVRVKAGTEAAKATAARVGLWQRATSLGGTESLIEHRASIEGPGSPVPGDLLRLSVGLEDAGDLYDDLDQALKGGNALG
ncbi:trans-sulfuration enzyme family protein [Dongia rigui]|uniref:PLP-dependent aspartate aminotransferase family protein n=1 Tax=Dongia rigui TaxID=940149 RepID=A0ABU5E5J5_9PROT|nr:PLP-dependent aspartate aminotransferase family protein [Dongia rigui]MDY0874490.1 PLP-dependent aspartate aminotransferase family protein [Dongia rigui]